MLQGRANSGPVAQPSVGPSSKFSQSPNSYATHKIGTTSMFGDSYEPNQSSSSPGSIEVTSNIVINTNGIDNLDGTDADSGNSPEHEVTFALRRLEEQLSLNEDSFKGIEPLCREQENTHDSPASCPALSDHGQSYNEYSGRKGDLYKL